MIFRGITLYMGIGLAFATFMLKHYDRTKKYDRYPRYALIGASVFGGAFWPCVIVYITIEWIKGKPII